VVVRAFLTSRPPSILVEVGSSSRHSFLFRVARCRVGRRFAAPGDTPRLAAMIRCAAGQPARD
jgi:hypothetical protein